MVSSMARACAVKLFGDQLYNVGLLIQIEYPGPFNLGFDSIGLPLWSESVQVSY